MFPIQKNEIENSFYKVHQDVFQMNQRVKYFLNVIKHINSWFIRVFYQYETNGKTDFTMLICKMLIQTLQTIKIRDANDTHIQKKCLTSLAFKNTI